MQLAYVSVYFSAVMREAASNLNVQCNITFDIQLHVWKKTTFTV